MDIEIALPGGGEIPGSHPVVIIGANGSGKTRQSRGITAPAQIEFVNALRNTRVAPDLPATGVEQARANFSSQKSQSQGQPWELASDFDYMLSQLLAQYSAAAIEFQKRVLADPSQVAVGPNITPLKRIEELWANIFPGRRLDWRDWKPLVHTMTAGGEIEYSGNQMSDGEKAALYLAGRVLSFDGGLLVVDEPETHFHSLLAIRLWNALEDARQDVRFVYITHDLTFAMSRRSPTFVIASPTAGFRVLEVGDDLPEDVATALLGSASLSFYASRIVFCEGDEGSYDNRVYGAWFRGQDTVVRPVGSSQNVLRCVTALRESGIAHSLDAVGIVDRDHHPESFIAAMPLGVVVLPVHEVESLLAVTAVVAAVCAHVSSAFDEAAYLDAIRSTISEAQIQTIVLQRWKERVEPNLIGMISSVSGKGKSLADVAGEIPSVFDSAAWSFDPAALLTEEEAGVRTALAGAAEELLRACPGKQLLPVAARTAGLDIATYVNLIVDALRGQKQELAQLESAIESGLSAYLPPRFAEAARTPAADPVPDSV